MFQHVLFAAAITGALIHGVAAGQDSSGVSRQISSVDVASFQQSFEKKRQHKLMQNAVTKVGVKEIALDRSLVTKMDHTFSNTLDDWKATNQMRSGRCWIFAGLNVMRTNAMKSLLVKDFELSQNYTMFWDKLEKANYLLEAIIETAERPVDDRTVHYLLKYPVSDGGQWNMFAGLIAKYGVVPKSVMPETYSSSNTRGMNSILRRKLREGAKKLRDLRQASATAQEIRAAKKETLITVYRVLSIHLGTPPESFFWQWKKKDGKFHRDGKLTPKQFAKKYVDIPFGEYVCLVNDPRESSPTGRTFTVEFLGNTGAAALPLAVAIGIERGHLQTGDRVALLGIGSGLNAIMLGIDWRGTNPVI